MDKNENAGIVKKALKGIIHNIHNDYIKIQKE